MHKVFINDTGESFSLPHNSYLSDAAELSLAGLVFGCRMGACGICAIEVLDGIDNVSEQLDSEKDLLVALEYSSDSVRLACQCRLRGDIKIKQC